MSRLSNQLSSRDRLSPKQEKFCLLYASGKDAVTSAKEAGYSDNYARSRVHVELLKLPKIRGRLVDLNEELAGPLIADAEERQIFWTQVMRDESLDTMLRLRASEILGRAQGDFIHVVEHQGSIVEQMAEMLAGDDMLEILNEISRKEAA